MTTIISAPELIGTREQVSELLCELPLDLSGLSITVNFDLNKSARPSFIDELIKEILVVRNAKELSLKGVSETVHDYAQQSADRRQVHNRLTFD